MNKEEILKQINSQFNGENYSTIISNLSKMYGKDEKIIKKYIDEMLQDGDLVNTSKKKISTSKSVGIVRGIVQITRNGSGFLLVENGEDIYIPRDALKGACAGDEVVVKLDYKNGKFESRGVIKNILKHSVTKFVGTIDILKNVAFVRPDRVSITKDVIIPIEKIGDAKNGDKVYVEITNWSDKEIKGVVTEVLGKSNNVDTDVLCICRNYDLREEFPQYVLNVAKNCPKTIEGKDLSKRIDLRDQLIFTIDGIDTRDIDDAITLTRKGDNYLLGVHIADVGEYVPQNSILDKEAFLRGTSVYFPNNVFPMLPKELSNGICSLNEGEDRLTLSCEMEVNNQGEVVDSRIFEGVIRSKHKMNYDDCNAILKGDKELMDKYSDITPMLFEMQKLMEILENRRNKLGAIVFDVPELKIILNENKEIETFETKPHDIAERIIESFMICANETVARTFKKKLPFVYRIHEKPDSQKIDAFKDFISGFGETFAVNSENVKSKDVQNFLNLLKGKPYNLVANKVLLRSMSKAKYYPEPLGHYALALKDYTHFTSPIRRYCDLTIHRIIKKYLNNTITDQYKNQLKKFVIDASSRASVTEVTAEKCEREVDDYFKARYMRNKIGMNYVGTINGTIDSGIFVELNENTVEGFISVVDLPGNNYTHDENRHLLTNGHYKYQMGDKIEVIVASVDMFRRKINFVLKDRPKETYDIEDLFREEFSNKKMKNNRDNKNKSKKGRSTSRNGNHNHK